MSTTETYSGFGGQDRNSSRVLNPPGGASSFSLGMTDPEPPKPPARQSSQTSAPAPIPPTSSASKESTGAKYNPITGEQISGPEEPATKRQPPGGQSQITF